MRKSQKTLLTSGGVIAGAILLVAVLVRIALSQVEPVKTDFQSMVMDSADLVGFDRVRVDGAWKVKLVQGDDWEVEVNPNDDQLDNLEVSVRNEQLNLRQRSSFKWWGNDSSELEARIQMPALKHLRLTGAVEAEMSGFEGQQLDIKTAGAIDLEGEQGRYEKLVVEGAGAIDLDFRDTLVTDASVDLAGASQLILTMNGGALTGSISGAGSIDYYGTVSMQEIKISGAGEVDHKD